MGYAFISYSSKDKAALNSFKDLFKKNGIEFWVAPEDIPAGSNYATAINLGIKNCACVVLLLTKNSLSSQWVPKEIERAINYNKVVIPILLEEVTLTNEIEFYISSAQILNIPNIEEDSAEVYNLISALKTNLAVSNISKEYVETEMINESNKTSPNSSPVTTAPSSKSKKPIIILIVSILAAMAIMFIFVFSKILPIFNNLLGGNNNNNDYYPSSSVSEFSNDNSSAASQDNSASNVVTSTNQVPAEYEDDITALKSADALSLSVSTVRVKVGGTATPQAAQTWSEAVIYSQDTSIVVPEGRTIRGVSKGETYIVVIPKEGFKMAEAYYVIVN